NGSDIDPAELIEHCRRRLARYKVPRRIEVRDRLPTTEAGKAVRRLVR
ncbi:MAG: AMP-binding enzyme C-terminal domain, partial [Acidimicrobiia bacterium]|nr:AMP-binding enzyme C-terminal domain [Acidimicrobiia bacterium]